MSKKSKKEKNTKSQSRKYEHFCVECGRHFKPHDHKYTLDYRYYYCGNCAEKYIENHNASVGSKTKKGKKAAPGKFIRLPALTVVPGNILTMYDGDYLVGVKKGNLEIREHCRCLTCKNVDMAALYGYFVIEVKDGDAVLFLPNSLRANIDDCDLNDKRYEPIRKLFDKTKCRDKRILIKDDSVVGFMFATNEPHDVKKFDTMLNTDFCIGPFTANYESEPCGYDKTGSCDITDDDVSCDGSKAHDKRKRAAYTEKESAKYYDPFSSQIAEAASKITPSQMLEYFENRLIGQDESVRDIVYLFYSFLKSASSGKPFHAPSWILTAPSGCGKTEVYRILKDFFTEHNIPIPVVQIDITAYTEAGYVGKNASDIISRLMDDDGNGDGTAICFLDEADKKCMPSVSSQGSDFNLSFQTNLLTLIEGKEETLVKRGHGITSRSEHTIDTNKTMFVLVGAFQQLREDKQNKARSTSSIGFGGKVGKQKYSSAAASEFYDDLDIEDIIDFGMMQELAGRMEQVINLRRLSDEDMGRIVKTNVKTVSQSKGIEVTITDKAAIEIGKLGHSKLGIRNVINRINTLVQRAVKQVYYDSDFSEDNYIVNIVSADRSEIIKRSLPQKAASAAN